MDKLKKLHSNVKQSAFYKSASYSVNVDFKSIFNADTGVLLYNDFVSGLVKSGDISSDQVTKFLTPEFQRKNNKWTRSMQVRFVENLLCGLDTEIKLFCIGDSSVDFVSCYILDGLQRLTAISDYHKCNFSVFDNISWSDISDRYRNRTRLKVGIYTFSSEIEAVKFYIQMNEGITHSHSDIRIAYEYLKTITPESISDIAQASVNAVQAAKAGK